MKIWRASQLRSTVGSILLLVLFMGETHFVTTVSLEGQEVTRAIRT